MALTNVWLAGYGGPPPAASGATAVWIAPNDGTVPSATQVTLVGWNGPVSGATPVWIAGYGGPPPVAIGAIPIWISGWQGSGGGGSTSVWSAADASANAMTLSNGGLTVVNPNSAWLSIRNTVSKTSGKLYVEFAVSGTISNIYAIFGLANGGYNVSGGHLGSSNYSGGIWIGGNDGNLTGGGFTLIHYPPGGTALNQNDVWALAVDFATGNMWVAQNNVWDWGLGCNPATGANPMMSFVPATVGALFFAMSLYGSGAGLWTLQATAAGQKYAPPAGFSAWG